MSRGPIAGTYARIVNMPEQPRLNGQICMILLGGSHLELIEVGLLNIFWWDRITDMCRVPKENLVQVKRKTVWEEVPW